MEIYNQLPKELQSKVFYFMSHPCADMIKSSLHFNPKEYIHPYFLISKKIKFWNHFWIVDYTKGEKWWNGLKDKISREREMDAQWKERKLMDKNDYDAETGRTFNDDSDDDSDDESSEDDSESSEDNNSDDYESESSEGNRNDNESESSEGDNNDNESVSSDPDPDDEYAECANDPELEYLFISEWDEFDHYDPYYAYLD